MGSVSATVATGNADDLEEETLGWAQPRSAHQSACLEISRFKFGIGQALVDQFLRKGKAREVRGI
jgi:hypothetical protein